MRSVEVIGILPLARMTGSKYRVDVRLDFESRSEREAACKAAGIPSDTDGLYARGSVYLDLGDRLMQEPFFVLRCSRRLPDGRRLDFNVRSSRLWKGAIGMVREHLARNGITGGNNE